MLTEKKKKKNGKLENWKMEMETGTFQHSTVLERSRTDQKCKISEKSPGKIKNHENYKENFCMKIFTWYVPGMENDLGKSKWKNGKI